MCVCGRRDPGCVRGEAQGVHGWKDPVCVWEERPTVCVCVCVMRLSVCGGGGGGGSMGLVEVLTASLVWYEISFLCFMRTKVKLV